MRHLRGCAIPVSAPVETIDGRLYCRENLPVRDSDVKSDFLISLVEELPGVTFCEAGCPVYLLPEIGQLVGKLDMALKNCSEKLKNDSLWELTKLPLIMEKINRHCLQSDMTMGKNIVNSYNKRVLPILNKLQSGLIHGDVNKNNIIVKASPCVDGAKASQAYVISGLIDFADCSSSFYIYELATLMADVMSSSLPKDCFDTGSLTFKGYVKEFPINETELSVLRLCVCIRLLQSYVLRSESMTADPDNMYLNQGREENINLCRRLWQLTDDEFLRHISD